MVDQISRCGHQDFWKTSILCGGVREVEGVATCPGRKVFFRLYKSCRLGAGLFGNHLEHFDAVIGFGTPVARARSGVHWTDSGWSASNSLATGTVLYLDVIRTEPSASFLPVLCCFLGTADRTCTNES